MHDYAFLTNNPQLIPRAFTNEQIAGRPILCEAELMNSEPLMAPYIFSIWGMPVLTAEQIADRLPNLRAVFYAAGTVQAFARPFLQKGIRVFSAWVANGVPVAEFAVAQIVLANKGFFQLHRRYSENWDSAVAYADTFPGNYDVSVGLLGVGAIGRLVIGLLKPYQIHVKVFDPFLSDAEAALLGVEKTTLADIFTHCQTISNHLANNAQTQHMLTGAHFAMMKDNATFINTGRGAQVDVAGLIHALREKPSRTALLDVTDPDEPLTSDSPLWSMPNVLLSPHRAGSATQEIRRMGAYMFEEYERVLHGEAVRYEVTMRMLETMA